MVIDSLLLLSIRLLCSVSRVIIITVITRATRNKFFAVSYGARDKIFTTQVEVEAIGSLLTQQTEAVIIAIGSLWKR